VSDFDTVLERLLSDPSFARALATDRAVALGGYRLSADEVELLSTQFSADLGGQSAVETRTNKSSVFGLLQSLPGLGAAGGGAPGAGVGGSGAGGGAGSGVAGVLGGHGSPGTVSEGFGAPADSTGGFVAEGFGPAADGGAGGGGGAMLGSGGTGSGAVGGLAMGGAVAASHYLGGGSGIGGTLSSSGLTDSGTAGFGGPGDGFPGAAGGGFPGGSGGSPGGLGGVLNDQFDPSAGPGQAGVGPAEAQPPVEPFIAPPKGYHTHVDVDGDGHWDNYTLRGRRDGGVDIVVDMNHDGRPDFIGHDTNADGLVESADYDENHDGVFETHMYDDNGDGWLDRTVVDPTPPPDQGLDDGMGRPFGAASVDPGLVPDPVPDEGMGQSFGAAGVDPDLVPDQPDAGGPVGRNPRIPDLGQG
jgi:hypothetical protein